MSKSSLNATAASLISSIMLLKKNKIKEKISSAINREIATGMTKVKLATKEKIAGSSCYEFRTNIGKSGSVRLAFAVDHETATVYFISSDVQKSTFSQELAKVVEGER